jgi:hypothetical protein
MTSGHFYHAHIRRIVTVFGTIFNNINIIRKDQTGKVIHSIRVPLAYGPKAKFLQRLDEQKDLQGNKVAMKLPRMSFEITTMVYDATTKLNRNNVVTSMDAGDTLTKHIVRTFAPYRMNFQLSIMAKNQDDALQVMEQILPYFQPEYTVTVKELDSSNVTTDVPFVLTNVTMEDTYEGDFTTRRAIIYTLDFEARIRFYGPISRRSIIKYTDVDFITNDFEKTDVNIHTTLGSIEDTPEDYTVIQTKTDFGFNNPG